MAGNGKGADHDHPENCLLRTGYIFKYNYSPIVWKVSYREISPEAKYVAMSQDLRQALPLIHLLKEFNCLFPDVGCTPSSFKYKVYEYNIACISIAESEKYTPQTKHTALKYHLFR